MANLFDAATQNLKIYISGTLEKEMATHSGILAWKNSGDGGAWRTTVPGVSESRTRLGTQQQQQLSTYTISLSLIFFPPCS